jgi:uncharacterized protein
MRGSYAASYLATLANGYAKRRGVTGLDVGAAFDLIVGTSTGAIIGCALAKGIQLSDVVDLYESYGKEIFRQKLPSDLRALLSYVFQRKRALVAGTAALRRALEQHFGQMTLAELYERRRIALAIPAVEMSQHHPWIFKTPHLPQQYYRDGAYRLADVCLATSAAPVYRSLASVDFPDGANGFHVFADGGLWANNPVLVAIIEALRMTEPGRPIQIFCLGTCSYPQGEQISKNAVHRGVFAWRLGGAAVPISLDAQASVYDSMAGFLAGHLDRPCSVVRFPRGQLPLSLAQYLALDDARDEAVAALIRHGRDDAHMASSRLNAASEDGDAMIDALFRDAPAHRTETQIRP